MFLTKISKYPSNSFNHWVYAGFFINHLVCSIHLLKMSTCPRCGTGNFKEGRSLSMHLSRFCSGPTLLCNTFTGLLPSKPSTQQMRSESSRTTFQQQIRMFDSLASDVSFPIRNPLHSMPSLVHLSSTQSQLEYSNVNTLDLTSTFPHQIQLMMKWTSLMIHYQFFQ